MKTMDLKVRVNEELDYEELKEILSKQNVFVIEDELPASSVNNGKKLAEILEKIASEGGLESFPDDISEWQREQRKDRKLPFRDE